MDPKIPNLDTQRLFPEPSSPTSHSKPATTDSKKPDQKIRDSIDQEYLQELRQKFKQCLFKFSNTDTREVSLNEAKRLIERNNSFDTLKIYVGCLTEHIKSKSPAARKEEVYLFEFLAKVYKERLIEESTPLRMLAKMAEGVQEYFKDMNRKVQESAAKAFCALFKYCLPKTSQALVFNFVFEPLNSIFTNGLDVQAQQTAALTIFRWACMLSKMKDKICLLTLFNKTLSLFLKLRSEFYDLLSALGIMLQNCGFYPIMDSMPQLVNKINSYLKNSSNNSQHQKLEACKLIHYIGKYLIEIQYNSLEKLPTEIIKSLKELKSEKLPALQNSARETLKIWECFQKLSGDFFEFPEKLCSGNISIVTQQDNENSDEVGWGIGNKGFLKKGSGNYSVVEACGQIDLDKARENRPSVKEFLLRKPFSYFTKSVEILFKENSRINIYERPTSTIFEIEAPSADFSLVNNPFPIIKDSEVRNSNSKFWLKQKPKVSLEPDSDNSAEPKKISSSIEASPRERLAKDSELKNSNEKFHLRKKKENKAENFKRNSEFCKGTPKNTKKNETNPGVHSKKSEDEHKVVNNTRKKTENKDEDSGSSESFHKNTEKSNKNFTKPEKKEKKVPDSIKNKESSAQRRFFPDKSSNFPIKSQNLNIIPESIEEFTVKSKPLLEAEVKNFSKTSENFSQDKEKVSNPPVLHIKSSHKVEIRPKPRRHSEILTIETDLDIEKPSCLSIVSRKTPSTNSTPKENLSIGVQTPQNIRKNSINSEAMKKTTILSIINLNASKLQKNMSNKFMILNKKLDFIHSRLLESAKILNLKKNLLKKSRQRKNPSFNLATKIDQKSQFPIFFSPKVKIAEPLFDGLTYNWNEVLDIMKKGQYAEGISKLLALKDDLYLLRLMYLTDPCLKDLPEGLGKKLMSKLIEILESRFVEKISFNWINEGNKLGMLEGVNKNVLDVIKEKLGQLNEFNESVLENSNFIEYSVSQQLFN